MSTALSSNEYRLLVEHSPVMLWRAGLNAKCDYFNVTWLTFTGRSLAEEQGDGWAAGVHPEDFKRCVAYYLDHFQKRQPFEMEYRLRRHDGLYRWIFDRGVPYHDDAGNFAGFIGSCVDIDERRQTQATEAQQNQDQLLSAQDFEKWILAIVGHDIRNPLSSIRLAADVLDTFPDPASMISKVAGRIRRGVDRIQHIVGDLLDLARERTGSGIAVHPQPLDLKALCRQIIDEHGAIVRERRITLECDVDTAGEWDEHRVLQALSNLTSNALKHGDPDAPIRVRVTGDADRVVIEIKNAGTIPAELLPRIFEPFRSGRNDTTRSDDGLGLGLFIANAIARAHGGGLEADSAHGVTKFRLVLPRVCTPRDTPSSNTL